MSDVTAKVSLTSPIVEANRYTQYTQLGSNTMKIVGEKSYVLALLNGSYVWAEVQESKHDALQGYTLE